MQENQSTRTETRTDRPNLSSPEAQLIGRKLRALRTLANIDQQELADRCGLKKSTVMSIEMGRYNAGIRQIVQMANALGYDLKFTERPTNQPTV